MRSHTPPFGSHYTHVHALPEHTNTLTQAHLSTHTQQCRRRLVQSQTSSAIPNLPVCCEIGHWQLHWINGATVK